MGWGAGGVLFTQGEALCTTNEGEEKKWREGAVDGVGWGTVGRDRQSEWFPRRH